MVGQVRAGTLTAIAVTPPPRYPTLAEVPTFAESGLPGYDVTSWYGLSLAAGTPQPIVDRLNKAVNEILTDPKAKARFTELGAILLPGSAAEFGKLVADETEKWGKVVKFAGAKVD